MSITAIFFIGVLAVALIGVFVYVSVREVKVSPPGVTPLRGLLPLSGRAEPLTAPALRPWRVLVATDGSPCSDRAVQTVAMRPWPQDSEIAVVSVARTRIPDVPDLLLMIEASHVDAIEAARQRAPGHVHRAQQCVAAGALPGVSVTGKVLEGDPEEAILTEAGHWHADVIVLGSHGYGPMRRRLLGSVAHAVALHAPCSVEIVRCSDASAQASGPQP
jgi:nucleotide-binding universal stress UspA family protein